MTDETLPRGIRRNANRYRAVAMVKGKPVYKSFDDPDKAIEWREKQLAINKRKTPPGGHRSKKRSNAKNQDLPAGYYQLDTFDTRVDGTKVERHKIGTTIFQFGRVIKTFATTYNTNGVTRKQALLRTIEKREIWCEEHGIE